MQPHILALSPLLMSHQLHYPACVHLRGLQVGVDTEVDPMELDRTISSLDIPLLQAILITARRCRAGIAYSQPRAPT